MLTTRSLKGSCYLFIVLISIFRVHQMNAANLLTNYLPASMQALAYYIDQLQYEPLATTTVEPPFSAATSATAPTTTTTKKPTTTRRPGGGSNNSNGWWQPPSWWQNNAERTTTTTRPTTTAKPTTAHRPALFAPIDLKQKQQRPKLEGYELFTEITDDTDFDRLPLSLIRDIQNEVHHDDFTNDVESLDNFLRLYDDNYGRAAFDFETAMDRWSSTSTAGKKRVPPTKPYVDFLLVYDLLKRDAKASNLSKYEGYSEELLQELYQLSQMSAQHQLHSLFQRMLDRREIQRSDVVSRIQAIVKDLSDPNSPTSKALKYIPTLQFLP